MILRIAEITSAVWAWAVIAQVGPVGAPGGVSQWGALGILAVIIGHIIRRDQRRDAVLDRKDTELAAASARTARLAAETTDAIREMSATMKDRPCLSGASRVDQAPRVTT